MDNFEEILNFHKKAEISKDDQIEFNELVPVLFDIANTMENKAPSVVDDKSLEKVANFFQSRTDHEIEEMATNYIELHANDSLGKAINLPQLFELIHRYGKTSDEPLKGPDREDRIIQDTNDMYLMEQGTSGDILKRFDDTRK